MRIAFVIFDGMTTLDFVGVFDAVTRLKTMGFRQDLEWDVCARSREVTDGTGLKVIANKVGEPLSGYDLVFVPGGFGTRTLQKDESFLAWLKTAHRAKYKVSVCTGSLLWGAAGYLKGLSATTHPTAFDELKQYAAGVTDSRVVDEGSVITARGVSSSIDLGLYLCEKFAGREAMEKIRKQMDYRG